MHVMFKIIYFISSSNFEKPTSDQFSQNKDKCNKWGNPRNMLKNFIGFKNTRTILKNSKTIAVRAVEYRNCVFVKSYDE